MIGRTNAGGGLGISTLVVQTDSGSVVTAAKGEEVKTAREKYGVWTFPALSAGDWTVRAEKDGIATTKTVTMDGTSSLTLILYFNQIPAFDYTGDYEIVDDNNNPITASQGNWKIRFLTSGTLTFTELRGAGKGIDVFLVGAGGAGGGDPYRNSELSYTYPGAGGGGYTKTLRNISVGTAETTQYAIVIGAGGSTISGGSTSAFGSSAAGGSYGHGPNGSNCWNPGGNGGSGGGAGYGQYGAGGAGGVDGGNGGNRGDRPGGKGQGSTTREFGEAGARLYSTGGNGNGKSAGADNTGDGGDAMSAAGLKGGSGIVIIRNAREVD